MSSIWARTVIWLCFVLLLYALCYTWKRVDSEDSEVTIDQDVLEGEKSHVKPFLGFFLKTSCKWKGCAWYSSLRHTGERQNNTRSM